MWSCSRPFVRSKRSTVTAETARRSVGWARGESDDQLAIELASSAADLLVTLQREAAESGVSGWPLEDAGDDAAHRHLIERLGEARPDDAVLSEEGVDSGQRLGTSRTWIVDPLDGSNGYGRANGEWAVHVALVENGLPVAGAVATPGLGLVGSTGAPSTTDRSDRTVPVVVTGRSRAWLDGVLVAETIDGELRTSGSAGLKAMLVVSGRADVYVHASPLYEWDACAPAAVARAAGLAVCAPDGSDLRFNQRRPIVPGLVICRPDLLDPVLGAVSQIV